MITVYYDFSFSKNINLRNGLKSTYYERTEDTAKTLLTKNAIYKIKIIKKAIINIHKKTKRNKNMIIFMITDLLN